MIRGSAILAGATGLVGGHCVRPLLDRYRRLVVIGRRLALDAHPRLSEHVVDFESLEEHAELLAGDDLFCCLGTTLKAAGSKEAFRRVDHDYVVKLARLAHERGVERLFLVSALGADVASRIFYNRVKGETETAVGGVGFRAVHISRPSLLLGERHENRPAERLGQWLGRLAAPLMRGPLAPYKAIAGADVAAALVARVDSEEEGVNIHYPRARGAAT